MNDHKTYDGNKNQNKLRINKRCAKLKPISEELSSNKSNYQVGLKDLPHPSIIML